MPIHKGETIKLQSSIINKHCGKICEKIVKDRWLKFLEETKTLSGGEFGYIGGRSCMTNTGKRKVVGLHLPGPQKGFGQGTLQETALETTKCRRIEE